MKLKLLSLGTLLFWTSLASNAGTTDVANHFVDALQHQRYREAAAMFASASAENTAATARTLQRIDGAVGGLSSVHPIAVLPDGKSVKLEVSSHPHTGMNGRQFVQLRYASTASDGQPVFYEVNLTKDQTPARILSLGVHFPAADTRSSQRANQLVTAIKQ